MIHLYNRDINIFSIDINKLIRSEEDSLKKT